MNKTQLLPDRPGIPPMAKLPDPETVDPGELLRAYESGEIDLICVLGPTASGKTRYAVELARALGKAEILSADSRHGPMSAAAVPSPSCAGARGSTSNRPPAPTSSKRTTASR